MAHHFSAMAGLHCARWRMTTTAARLIGRLRLTRLEPRRRDLQSIGTGTALAHQNEKPRRSVRDELARMPRPTGQHRHLDWRQARQANRARPGGSEVNDPATDERPAVRDANDDLLAGPL